MPRAASGDGQQGCPADRVLLGQQEQRCADTEVPLWARLSVRQQAQQKSTENGNEKLEPNINLTHHGKEKKKRDGEGGGPQQIKLTSHEAEQILPATATESVVALTSTLQDILWVIAASRTALEVKIDTLSIDLGLLPDDIHRLAEWVSTTGREISAVTPALALANGHLTSIEARLKVLERRVEDAENRERCNIRLVGLPEKVEDPDMVSYLGNWLRTEVAPEGLSPFFALERPIECLLTFHLQVLHQGRW
ncbi:hypothetical protein NDU88_005040 [Pleurodeles waltl]|uniref:Uncharacterized protein n=1 Tax=Pleurodeles waltl TaxID=8319 RepID=A0AAV7VKH3_PLEWA|nr:hypothetical protein NDU88_005040 [Pleurodeles waltl]